MKRKSWAPALVAALCLALATPVAAADPARPFAGHDRVVDTFVAPTTCPASALWRYAATGTGLFLHLGRASVSVTHCTFVDFATGTGTFGPGTITLAAANGCRIREPTVVGPGRSRAREAGRALVPWQPSKVANRTTIP